MGDIARHRDISLNTLEAVPELLLSRCGLTKNDLTYLELGNYFTDVSQFRDPVFYLFAKQTVWREEVLPGADKDPLLRGIVVALDVLAELAAALMAWKLDNEKKALAALPAAVPLVLAGLNSQINNLAAGILGIDDWLDNMLGKPIEKLDKSGKRKSEDFGYVGRFFEHFTAAVTQMLFADDVPNGTGASSAWSKFPRLPASAVSAVFDRCFTQYFPHEHTDQPPYVWDASERPGKRMYEPAPRRLGPPVGIMGIVHDEYIDYLSEGLTRLEQEWRGFKPTDFDKRRMWLLDMGKILHGIEDWFFHSNIVDLTRLHAHRPDSVPVAERQQFLKKTIIAELGSEPEYQKLDGNKRRLERFYYRRLREPIYARGNKANTGGVPSTRGSKLNWNHVYPAFPSTLDTAHTLLGALEGIESKLHLGQHAPGGFDFSHLFSGVDWLGCVMGRFHNAGPEWAKIYRDLAAQRNITLDRFGMPDSRSRGDHPRIQAWIIDVLRELVPLVLTLLYERERQRLVADVKPLDMPLDDTAPQPKADVKPGPGEIDAQLIRHAKALKPKRDAQGVEENNYDRAFRYLQECGSLNQAGREAVKKAFEVDVQSEKKRPAKEKTPGAGGFLIKFAVKLQTQIDEAHRVTKLRDQDDPFTSDATDNGSQNEIIGSHSLMSKDTKDSSPFFDDARILASVASLSTFQIMLEEVSAPGADRLDWRKLLHHFIRFPLASGGWEREAIAKFIESGRTKIPGFTEMTDFAQLKTVRMPAADAQRWANGDRAVKLREMYADLEKKLTRYRYP